jgi:catechol 2,3-dioxygenase-like lactoylglutathione lyase family enzyme
MLNKKDAVATIAVKDLEEAGKFYKDTLGHAQVGAENQQLLILKSGNTLINIYRSQYAGTNQATAMTWAVGDDLESIVQQLKAKGVQFEHYEMPGITRQGDIHMGGNRKVAWFKDPDGNILNIVNS